MNKNKNYDEKNYIDWLYDNNITYSTTATMIIMFLTR